MTGRKALKTPFGEVGSRLEADLCREKARVARRDHRLSADEYLELLEQLDRYCLSVEEEARAAVDDLRGFRAP